VGERVGVDGVVDDDLGVRAGVRLDDEGLGEVGAARVAAANLDENSPKLRCSLRSSISEKVAASQNVVVPPLPSSTS